MKILTPQQKSDILSSLDKIKKDIEKIQANKKLTDSEIIFFYSELKGKADFGLNFVQCAEIYSQMKANKKNILK